MHTYTELHPIIIKAIEEIQWEEGPKNLSEPAAYILSLGGKRARPILCLMACELFGGTLEEAMPAALAVEIFHNFTLVHDDIMDEAPLRRGKATVHTKYGPNAGILSGDYLFARVYEYLAKVPADKLSAVLTVFNRVGAEVCFGQQMDMDFEERDDVSIPEYMEMIRLKTAVLLATGMKMGAIIGGANEEDANRIYDFAINMGLAFQLRDDLLDSYGDAAKFGKKVGGDIIQNKKTYLQIMALESESHGAEMSAWLDRNEEEESVKVEAVKAIYDAVGIKESTQKLMDEYNQKADDLLAAIDRPEESKEAIRGLFGFLMNRES